MWMCTAWIDVVYFFTHLATFRTEREVGDVLCSESAPLPSEMCSVSLTLLCPPILLIPSWVKAWNGHDAMLDRKRPISIPVTMAIATTW